MESTPSFSMNHFVREEIGSSSRTLISTINPLLMKTTLCIDFYELKEGTGQATHHRNGTDLLLVGETPQRLHKPNCPIVIDLAHTSQ